MLTGIDGSTPSGIVNTLDTLGYSAYIFKIQLNDIKRLNVTRKQLNEPDLKDHIHIFEPFDSLYIKGKDENNSYSVLIENGNFHSITEVIIKARVFGILPYQYTTKILQLNEK